MPPPLQRRRFVFSLRTLLIVVTVCGLWLGWRTSPARRQRDAVEAILAFGGGVGWVDGESPNWLKETLGQRYPIMAYVSNKAFTDDDLDKILLPLKSLQNLSIDDVSVTDKGLLRLSHLKSLHSLQCIRDRRNLASVKALADSTTLDTDRAPLPDVLAYLGDLHGIPFAIDKQELSAAGLKSEVAITQKVAGNTLPLEEALDVALNPHGLGWVLKDGGVIVTSAKAANGDRRRVLSKQLRATLPNLKTLRID